MTYIKATGEEHAQIMKNFWDDNDEKMTKIEQGLKPEKECFLRTVLRTE